MLSGGSPPILGELPVPTPWTEYTFDVVATSALTALTFSGADLITVNDIDAGANAVQVTLNATNGTFTLNGPWFPASARIARTAPYCGAIRLSAR